MRELDIRKTQFTVADFLTWHREGSLNLNPPFQRRSVWKPDARSFFMDTVAKGLPAPIIYLRQRVDLESQQTLREVVDGQQRLRTVLGFVDPRILKKTEGAKDEFVIKKVHNKELAGKQFSAMSEHVKARILEYEFSTHVLPVAVEDRDVLEMFSRLNATGVKLNPQELRNAQFYGEFKSSMYHLALQQFDRWRKWNIFSDDQISRMKEVEMTSDLVMNMAQGLTGKTQKKLDDIYKDWDDTFPRRNEVERRFHYVMNETDIMIGNLIVKSAYISEVNFFSLFVLVYERAFGLGSALDRRKPTPLNPNLGERLILVSRNLQTQQLPLEVLDAVQRASADLGRRKTRLRYMLEQTE
jgi:uncharacterized protein with ParB-like and HNH nuclease domain